MESPLTTPGRITGTQHLTTERRNPRTAEHDRLSMPELVRALHRAAPGKG